MTYWKKTLSAILLGAVTTMMTTPVAAHTESKEYKESTGQYVSDSVITTKVKAAILGDSRLHVTDIKVRTQKGKVHLYGNVDNSSQIARATEVAMAVGGVKSVKNHLHLK